MRRYFASEEYKQYYVRIPLSLSASPTLFFKQLPQGITLLEESCPLQNYEFGSYIIRSYHKKFDVTDPMPLRLPAINFNAERRRRYFKRNLNLWKCVLGGDQNIVYKYSSFILQMNTSIPIDTFSSFSNTDEIYFPLAFLEKEAPVGGAYIYLWECKKGEITPSTPYLPISCFHMAACMFGSTLYGVDHQLQKHPMTEPNYKIPCGQKITSIVNEFPLHPDELFFEQSFVNFIPLIKALAQNSLPVIKHQVPLANYILYGINKFLNQEMTEKALEIYVIKVKSRAKSQQDMLSKYAEIHGVKIEFYSSLSPLNLDLFGEKDIIQSLFEHINLMVPLDLGEGEKNIIQILFFGIIKYLSTLKSPIGKIWKMVDEIIQVNPNLFDTHDLLQINYIDYSATMALIKQENVNQKICSIMPAHEKPIAIGYKNLFSEKLGPILCMNYLPSLQVGIEKYNNALFYLRDYIPEVNQLLHSGITTLSALQTASVALDSVDLSRYATEKLWGLISSKSPFII